MLTRSITNPQLPASPQTCGINPLSAIACVRKRGGPELLARVMASLSEADRVVLEPARTDHPRGLSSSSWVELAAHCRMLRTIDRIIGNGDLTSLFEVGRGMAEHDVNELFRFVLRMGNPGWVIEMAALLWRQYHDR